MTPKEFRRYVIRPSLEAIDMWSEAVENLLLGTAWHESGGFKHLKQVRGPALGLYQIEPRTHRDIWENYLRYRPDMEDRVLKVLSPKPSKEKQLTTNLAYATAIARLIYYRKPEALPKADNPEGLARYWKDHYNTELGKGRVEDFYNNYLKME